MKKYHAVIIEQSLMNPEVLGDFRILNSKISGDWVLDIIEIENIDDAIGKIQPAMMSNKPYYWHIYDGNENLIVVFKEKVFRLKPNDESTWQEAREYGAKLLKISLEQLDFFSRQFSDEPAWLASSE